MAGASKSSKGTIMSVTSNICKNCLFREQPAFCLKNDCHQKNSRAYIDLRQRLADTEHRLKNRDDLVDSLLANKMDLEAEISRLKNILLTRLPLEEENEVAPTGVWISLEERMPQEKEAVLTFGHPNDGGYYVTLCEHSNGIFTEENGKEHKGYISHWLSIPNTPGEGSS